ncbi:hypothetical protein TcasGA2_TC015836 [Tribolium castaneum]|uniref:Uncharacterized protein n=1 Tax=Tribolium castaneum TaxID=7070 RepID=D2A476_TRICA|nr:hypothetical protein TcasGA2_TC015836 [Tribolium castaneum]
MHATTRMYKILRDYAYAKQNRTEKCGIRICAGPRVRVASKLENIVKTGRGIRSVARKI